MSSIFSLLELFQPVFLLRISDEELLEGGILIFFFLLFVYALHKVSSRKIKVVHSHWHSMFETRSFTPEEFYTALQNDITKEGIEGLSISRTTYTEKAAWLSANRIYLRVKFRECMMDICAAPFAKEAFFVSWWLGDEGFNFRDVLISVPVAGRLFTRREKTFYEMDTETMFKETVAKCVKETIDQLTATKGMRLPDMHDWKGTALQFNKH